MVIYFLLRSPIPTDILSGQLGTRDVGWNIPGLFPLCLATILAVSLSWCETGMFNYCYKAYCKQTSNQ